VQSQNQHAALQPAGSGIRPSDSRTCLLSAHSHTA
jgi:hypothetical protein